MNPILLSDVCNSYFAKRQEATQRVEPQDADDALEFSSPETLPDFRSKSEPPRAFKIRTKHNASTNGVRMRAGVSDPLVFEVTEQQPQQA